MTLEEFCVLNGGKRKEDAKYKKKHTHGMSGTRLYGIWADIKIRVKNSCYKNDIKLCEEWQSFDSFLLWAYKSGYKKNFAIDRIDTNGDFCPENCRWITVKQKINSIRPAREIEYQGKSKTVREWAEFYGVEIHYIRSAFHRGWTFEEVAESIENPRKMRTYSNNTSGVRGVSYNSTHEKWQAFLRVKKKIVLAKMFDTKEEAIKARKEAERKYIKKRVIE